MENIPSTSVPAVGAFCPLIRIVAPANGSPEVFCTTPCMGSCFLTVVEREEVDDLRCRRIIVFQSISYSQPLASDRCDNTFFNGVFSKLIFENVTPFNDSPEYKTVYPVCFRTSLKIRSAEGADALNENSCAWPVAKTCTKLTKISKDTRVSRMISFLLKTWITNWSIYLIKCL